MYGEIHHPLSTEAMKNMTEKEKKDAREKERKWKKEQRELYIEHVKEAAGEGFYVL